MNDQYIIPLFVAGSLLLTLFGFFLVVYLLVQKRKQNKYFIEKQQMIFDHQNSLLQAKIEEHENIMDQISIELHDNVKSVLGFAQMNMYNIASLATDEKQATLIDKTNNIIGHVVDELHSISHSLNSNFVKNTGLVESIAKDLEHIQLSNKVECSHQVVGTPFSLTPEKELHIYRIAQEAIQNCMKHASAKHLNFTFRYDPRTFIMEARDDGKGFDQDKVYKMKGLGFLNMFQRARYLQGVLEVNSAPNNGSTITLTLILENNGTNDKTGYS